MLLQRFAASPVLSAIKLRCYSTHAPTVFDKMIQVTVTDLGGHRHILRGKEGDSLIDLLVKHEEELGGDSVIGLSSEGRGVAEAHVSVANEYLDAIPAPAGDDIFALNELAPGYTKNSRLASKVVLSRQFDNLSLALGKINPWRTL